MGKRPDSGVGLLLLVWYTCSMATLVDMWLKHKAEITLVGVSFCAEAVSHLEVGQEVTVVPEPNNEYDKNALRVILPNGQAVGYIPAALAERVSQESPGGSYAGHVAELHFHEGATVGAKIILDRIISG